jgi:thioredoxin
MSIETCARCGAKNRLDDSAAGAQRRPVCGRCGEPLHGGGASASSFATDAGKPRVVSDETFAADVLKASGARPVLLDCWAPWCGPCRMIAPVLDQLAAESEGRYTVAKLNVDENPRTSAQFQIQSIPTLLIFKSGQVVDRIVGAQPKHVLAARLAAHV